MQYKIVNAEKRHIQQLEQLEKQCFSSPWTAQMLETQLPDDKHVFIVAESDGMVLGYVGMMYVLDEGYISNVAVGPEYRRKGIADALIKELVLRCELLDLSFVTLEVRQSNDAARALYSKHGFSDVGIRKNYYDFPKENAILMTKFMK
ncbi:MAG: ribosomal protein S18-alanine N-acetyltransferase [Oscillospiraceae bacterium]|nr:ribosomal protein S18-alanine N-acetyltransferase [Oscillospiraceae bacterium]